MGSTREPLACAIYDNPVWRTKTVVVSEKEPDQENVTSSLARAWSILRYYYNRLVGNRGAKQYYDYCLFVVPPLFCRAMIHYQATQACD